MSRSLRALILLVVVSLGLTACGGETNNGGDGGASPTLVVGSQDYYSNEIIAELYAQALEKEGFTVDRQLRIGQREVYMPDIQSGKIDIFPEYTGNLLQYLDQQAGATASQEVYDALGKALPEGLRVLDQAEASDQDSFVITKATSEKHGATSLADLGGVPGLKLGGNSEMESRPYGPKGLKETYGIEVSFTPIEDSGGPLTVKALRDGQADIVNIYSANPVLADDDLVRLEDPEGLLLASQVVPVVSSKVDDKAAAVINKVSGALTQDDLVAMNKQSTEDQRPAADIAKEWLEAHP